MDWEDIKTSNLIDEQTYSILLDDLHHDASLQTPQTGGALVENDVYDAEEGYEPPQNQHYAEANAFVICTIDSSIIQSPTSKYGSEI